jgi:hypothetical protein
MGVVAPSQAHHQCVQAVVLVPGRYRTLLVLVEAARGVSAESLFLRGYQSLTERGQKELFESSTFIVLKLNSERM